MKIGTKEIIVIVKETLKGFWRGVRKTSWKKRIMLFLKSRKKHREEYMKWHALHHLLKQTVQGAIKGAGTIIDNQDKEASYRELKAFRSAMDRVIEEQKGEYVENRELFNRFKILVTIFSDMQGYYRDMFKKVFWYMYEYVENEKEAYGFDVKPKDIHDPSQYSKFFDPKDVPEWWSEEGPRMKNLKECSKKIGVEKNIKKEKDWLDQWKKKKSIN